jgi:hypothetical protein
LAARIVGLAVLAAGLAGEGGPPAAGWRIRVGAVGRLDGAAWGAAGLAGAAGAAAAAGEAAAVGAVAAAGLAGAPGDGGLAGAAAGRLGGGVGAATEAGRAAGGLAGGAFFTDRIALAGCGAAAASGAAGLAAPPLPRIRLRIREASSSLIELLWLLTVMESFSAASSTSLLSRPRSRDSS